MPGVLAEKWGGRCRRLPQRPWGVDRCGEGIHVLRATSRASPAFPAGFARRLQLLFWKPPGSLTCRPSHLLPLLLSYLRISSLT